MQPQNDYKQFLKMDKDKRVDYVQNAEFGAPAPVEEFGKYPDYDFINLVGSQDKKQIKLSTYRYPAQATKAVVIFFHGIGGHGGFAVNFAKAFSENGITFAGFDQRGHGRSEGEKGYFDSSKEMIKDSKTFILELKKIYPNVPFFLMGQAMGGLFSLVVAKQLKEFKLAGLILAAPSMKKPSHNPLMNALSGFALGLMPNKTGIFELKYENSTKNPTAHQLLNNDPLVYKGKVYSGSLTQVMSFMEVFPEKHWDKACEYPTVIIQGELDKIVDPSSTIEFYEKLKVQDKSFWWFPKMWNNIFLEKESIQIRGRLVKWVSERI